MNAVGDGNNINTIKMRHQGADMNFRKVCSPYHPGGIGVPVEREKCLSLEFQDICEIENLIYALQEFKEACQLHLGSWRRGRA